MCLFVCLCDVCGVDDGCVFICVFGVRRAVLMLRVCVVGCLLVCALFGVCCLLLFVCGSAV